MTNKEESDGSKYLREQSMEDEAKAAVKTAAEEMGEPLSRSDYNKWREQQDGDPPTQNEVCDWIGENQAWPDTCDVVGVKPISDIIAYSDEEIKTALKKSVETHGEPLSVGLYNTWRENQPDSQPSPRAAATRLGDGSWSDALHSIGIQSGEIGGSVQQYSEQEAEYALKQASEAVDRLLSTSEYRMWKEQQDEDHPSTTTIAELLGGGKWVNAVESVGLNHNASSVSGETHSWTDKDAENALKRAVRDAGQSLYKHQYLIWRQDQSDAHPSCNTIARRLGDGSWKQAKQNVLQKPD